MKLQIAIVIAAACCMIVGACGPLVTPMPIRLEPDKQKAVDDAWDRAFDPVDRLGDQTMLDAMMVSQAYQAGIDKLEFRSEKRCAAGLVVMEVHFDRRSPDLDQFVVTLVDASGRTSRRLTYSRSDVEQTYLELFVEYCQLTNDSFVLNEEQQNRRAELEARMVACREVFPPELTDGDNR